MMASRQCRIHRFRPRSYNFYKRCLHLHSFQSQSLLKEAGITIPRGILVQTEDQTKEAIKQLGGKCFVKPQFIQANQSPRHMDSNISADVKLVKSPEEGVKIASQILGHQVLPSYPGGKQHQVEGLFIQEAIGFDRNWQLCMTIDRENHCPVLIFREDGSIMRSQTKEHSASQHRFPFGFTEGITSGLIEQIYSRLGLSANDLKGLDRALEGMYRIFLKHEATTLEIDDLVRRSTDGQVVCMNSRFTFDDAAQSRQSKIFEMRDFQQEVAEELEAENHGIVYVKMDGNIGTVVNGAGLAMATNDAIKYYGGKSANFLDAGGKATKETMLRAFDIVLRNERVKAILVNVYGGITRCDMIAESVIAAASELGPIPVPVVVRLQGTNSEEGLAMLQKAKLGIHVESGFGEAAKKAVEVANQT